jgi:hypothetical protein
MKSSLHVSQTRRARSRALALRVELLRCLPSTQPQRRLQHSTVALVVVNGCSQTAHVLAWTGRLEFRRASARHTSEQNPDGRPAPRTTVEKVAPHGHRRTIA